MGHICRIHAISMRFDLRPFRFAVRLVRHIMTDDYFRTFLSRTSQGGDKYGAELPFIHDLTSIILRSISQEYQMKHALPWIGQHVFTFSLAKMDKLGSEHTSSSFGQLWDPHATTNLVICGLWWTVAMATHWFPAIANGSANRTVFDRSKPLAAFSQVDLDLPAGGFSFSTPNIQRSTASPMSLPTRPLAIH